MHIPDVRVTKQEQRPRELTLYLILGLVSLQKTAQVETNPVSMVTNGEKLRDNVLPHETGSDSMTTDSSVPTVCV